MKIFLFTIFISLFTFSSNAQITFQKKYGFTGSEFGWCVQQTSDKGYIMVGETDVAPYNSDVYLVKTDSVGSLLWTKTYGGQFWDGGRSVQQTPDGGYIVAGYSESFSSDTSNDVYVIRTDSIGDTLWTRTYGGTGYQVGTSVKQTADGGFIIGGTYLIKIDANGAIIWVKTYSNNIGISSVQQTADSGYIFIGGGTGVNSSLDVYLMKTDVSGIQLWTKTFGGTGFENGYSFQQTTDGGYIIAGVTNTFSPTSAVYLIRTDSVGNSLWTKTYGLTGQGNIGNSVQQATDGGFFITGSTSGPISQADTPNVYLIKTDTIGNLLWSKTYGRSSLAHGLCGQQTADGGYIAVGYITNYPPGAEYIYLIKTDANGNSGCYEKNIITLATSPPTIVTNPSVITYSLIIPVHAPASVVGFGGIDTALCISVGINELSTANLFFISPNPSTGNFTILLEGIIFKGKVEILNIIGETIFTENIFNESKKEINLKNVSDGIYFVKVFDGEKSYCKKLIIEHD